MEDIFVARIMSTDLHTVTPETLVEDAAQVMLDNDIGSVIVVDDDGYLEGILTTTDFVDIVAQSHPKAETAVSRYMSTDLVTATAQQPIQEVADAMITYGIHHMPVVDETEGVIGVVTTTDLAAYLADIDVPTAL
ncbi:CBS domain-containing protein [Halorarius litoreus]|uniref:CBS domain-containing protein n=1 Tax=Halorarius litoreus TaxID=2962676 RepID=UPI0020CBCAA2|nr:CBS domain-containing protein [Halorarius litoreus]